jgi:hypothetical protein
MTSNEDVVQFGLERMIESIVDRILDGVLGRQLHERDVRTSKREKREEYGPRTDAHDRMIERSIHREHCEEESDPHASKDTISAAPPLSISQPPVPGAQ